MRRFALGLLIIGLFLGAMPVLPGQYPARAQETTTVLGDPPVADGGESQPGDPDTVTLAVDPLSVDITSRTAVRNFYNSVFTHSYPALNWTGNFETCVPGTISVAYRQAFLNQINWYRAMAGLPGTVTESAAASQRAQAAALIMGKAGQLDHYPPESWGCYSELGAEGARRSNLGIGHWDFVTQYMQDAGANNSAAGHRRWILAPALSRVGIGTAGDGYTNALCVLCENSFGDRPAARDGFVAWPPAGYVPYQLFFGRWTFSYPNADFSSATVSVTRDGVSIPFTIEDRTSIGYGDNTIVFSNYSDWDTPTSDMYYTVTINNVRIQGGSHSFTYMVVKIDPARAGGGTLPRAVLTPDAAGPGESINYTINRFPANSQVSIIWRQSSSSSMNLGTVQTSANGTASGSLAVPAIPGGTSTIEFTTGTASKQVVFEVIPRVTILTPWGVPGSEIEFQTSGLRPNETVNVDLYNPGLDIAYWIEESPFTANANGVVTGAFTLPSGLQPGPHEVLIYDSNWDRHVGSGPLVLTVPPDAVAIGQASYEATTLITQVSLDGSGSTGADGVPITDWTWSTGGEPTATGEIATAQLPVGIHEIVLTITDQYGLTATDTLTVSITVAPQTAIANAGPDQLVTAVAGSASVTLDASGSLLAPGTTITSYRWLVAGNPTPIATTVNPTVTLAAGVHDITLEVTSSFNIVTTDTVRIVISAAPVAEAGPDQSVDTLGTTAQVTLDGRASTPPDGHTITAYRWTRPGISGALATTANPTVALPVGTHTITLEVTGSNGLKATDTVVVDVVKVGPPALSIDTNRATVSTKIGYTVSGFPRGSAVAITFTTNRGVVHERGTVLIDETGSATGRIEVPAAPGGGGHQITFALGSTSVSVPFEIAPRIRPQVTSAAPGQTVLVNLRGFAANDNVTIKWRVNGSFVAVGSARTSATGSVTNQAIVVPANAQGGVNTLRVEGTINQQSNAITIVAPTVSISPVRTTVNSKITYTISQYPANSLVSITWVRLTGSTIDLGTVQTDASGAATGQITVPATPGGVGQQIRFTSGGVTKTVLFEIAPRVKVTPAPAARGEMIDISLRGFARQEAIRIRWRLTGSTTWIVLATGTTSNTGSANIKIPVPGYAVDGTYQLRAETTSFNQQTNVVQIAGGIPVQPAEAPSVTPEPETTPVTIDRTALPLEVPAELVAIRDEANTQELKRLLTDGDLATGWSGTPDPIRQDARLTIDLGATHALRGFGWLTETGGCGQLTGLEYSVDGETWAAIDPSLQPGPIGEEMVWRYQAITEEARYLRFTFAPEHAEQTAVGCLAEVAVWGTRIEPEPVVVETPVPTEPATEETPVPTEPAVEESTAEPTLEAPADSTEEPTPVPESGE